MLKWIKKALDLFLPWIASWIDKRMAKKRVEGRQEDYDKVTDEAEKTRLANDEKRKAEEEKIRKAKELLEKANQEAKEAKARADKARADADAAHAVAESALDRANRLRAERESK